MPRQAELRKLHVVAGILQDPSGRVLIAERVDDGPFHGLWEFPGGKIKSGESPETALARELAEEIGVTPAAAESLMSLQYDYPDRSVAIEFFLVSDWCDEPCGLEGQQLDWVPVDRLDTSRLLPANLPVVEALRQRANEHTP